MLITIVYLSFEVTALLWLYKHMNWYRWIPQRQILEADPLQSTQPPNLCPINGRGVYGRMNIHITVLIQEFLSRASSWGRVRNKPVWHGFHVWPSGLLWWQCLSGSLSNFQAVGHEVSPMLLGPHPCCHKWPIAASWVLRMLWQHPPESTA